MRVLISARVLLKGLLLMGTVICPKMENFEVSHLSKKNIYVNDVHSTSIDCFLLSCQMFFMTNLCRF